MGWIYIPAGFEVKVASEEEYGSALEQIKMKKSHANNNLFMLSVACLLSK